MSFLVDIIIVAVILLFTFIGYKRGLVKLAFSLCSFFIAIAIAFSIYKPITNIILDKTSIDESISKAITDRILPEGASINSEFDANANFPEIIINKGANTVGELANSFSSTIVGVCCFIVIYIVVRIALKFVTALANLIAKLPLLKQFNELGGLIYGACQGVFIVFLGFAVISLASPLMDADILSNINNSMLGSWVYNNNFLLNLIK